MALAPKVSCKAPRSNVETLKPKYLQNADMRETMQQIRNVLGEIPILASEQRLLEQAEAEAQQVEDAGTASLPVGTAKKATSSTRVLADGTYATETAYSSSAAHEKLEKVKNAQKPPLRALLLGGDFYTGTVLAATLTKLVLRFAQQSKDPQTINSLRAEVSDKVDLSL